MMIGGKIHTITTKSSACCICRNLYKQSVVLSISASAHSKNNDFKFPTSTLLSF